MSDDEPTGEDILSTATTIWDVFDMAHKLRLGGRAAGVDNPLVSSISTALDLVSVGRGGYNLIDGAIDGDSQQMVEGGAGIFSGGLGIASTLLDPKSTPGAVVGAFATGYGVGELIAPRVFPELGKGYADGMGEDGKYHPSSGSPILDSVIGWFTDD